MSIYDWNPLVSLKDLGKASGDAKSELFETYDQLRDMTVSGSSIAGAGTHQPNGFISKFASMFGSSSFLPALGNKAMNIPGTSFYDPVQAGTGTVPGGSAPFGVGPMSQFSSFPAMGGGSAAGLDALSILASAGIGNGASGIGDPDYPMGSGTIGGMAGGQAAMIGSSAGADPGADPSGDTSTGGFGRNLIMPAAGLMSGIGGVLTTMSSALGPGIGLAGMAAGTVLNGLSGAVLSSYNHVGTRILNNADTAITNKARDIETVVQQLGAQEEIIKKLMKEQTDQSSKLLQNIDQ